MAVGCVHVTVINLCGEWVPKVNSIDDSVDTFVYLLGGNFCSVKPLFLCNVFFRKMCFYRVLDLHEDHLANIVRPGEESRIRWPRETRDGIENKG